MLGRNSFFLAAVRLLVCLPGFSSEQLAAGEAPRILTFTETGGFRHASIPDALVAVTTIAEGLGFTVEKANESSVFSPENLSRYAAVVFLLTSGDILNEEEQVAFEGYIRAGGGYMGIHSASDTEYSWPWYGQLVGAYFANHPQPQTAIINVEDRTHPSTKHLPERWVRFDEWYNFRSNPRNAVNILLTLDESTYTGGTMGGDHPIAWYHAFDGGRSWYTGGGHTSASYQEEDFLKHLRGGLLYAALGLAPNLVIQELQPGTGTVTLRLSASANQQVDIFQSPDLRSWSYLDSVSIDAEGKAVEFQSGLPAQSPYFFRAELNGTE